MMTKTRAKEKSELMPGTLDMLILRTLTRGVMHGYGIAQHIKLLSEDVLQVEEGSLYPALQRLQLQGWVTSQWAQSENNRRARYYRLTPEGKRRLEQEVTQFEQMMAAIARVMRTA
jgi:PadR family transcriptional regulator, regulatory protein PadR